MAPTQSCAKYQYVVTPNGPKILPVEDPSAKDEESPADYNAGGYLPVKLNDTFKNGRYRVVRKLGWGHFSTVWLVKDTHTHCHSALKVVKSAGRYAETARDEIKLLSRVSAFSPTHPGQSHIVSFLDSFSYQGPEASHVCIVFEPLGENLLALIERNKKKGVPRALVKVIAKQILLGLQYLHDECDLVHTDIKPENILISIPDIEAHIQNELSQSPTPTSRRVGVPLPTKSRAGVSIPQSQQRARRQVQIFDSQPLASPGRSVDLARSGHASMSNVRQGNSGSGSGSNSLAGSYVAQMHLARLTGSGAITTSGTAKSLSSTASKFPSGLSTSEPRSDAVQTSNSDSRLTSGKHFSSALIPNPNPLSPSTSSSSSSIFSTVGSTTAGSSSIISTPPTSLSHSIGNVVAGFMGLTKVGDQLTTRTSVFVDGNNNADGPREGLPMQGKKGKGKMNLEDELEAAASTSWNHQLRPSSWTDKISASLSSSYKSTTSMNGKSKLCQVQSNGHGHSRSHSGLPAPSYWKDPGTAAPAPALLVSAVAGADKGDDTGPYFDFAAVSIPGCSTTSESSSATATVAQPSRNGTPNPTEKSTSPSKVPASKTLSLLNGVKKAGAETRTLLVESAADSDNSTPNPSIGVAKPSPSLLTQTAPLRMGPSPSKPPRTTLRPSPPHHKSQLSAHMHSHLIACVCSESSHDHNLHSRTSKANISHTNARNITATTTLNVTATTTLTSPTSVTPTPTTPPPSAPPPTPVESPSTTTLIPAPVASNASSQTPSPPIPLPISTEPLVPSPPPISIKIADLGNATPSKKHYTEDIQTRQYRAPEAILGKRDWDARADIWSVACVVFELLTAEFLFDPHGQGELFTKDDDHMAQVIELLGDYPLEVKMGGKYSRELFDHSGALRYIKTLKPWPLKRVMTEKYLFSEQHADALCEFLLPMLAIDMRQRANARDMLDHPWLTPTADDEVVGEW